MARNWGVTTDAIKEVIRAGRLPLIECETDGAEMLKKRGIDCLTIFLKPPSVEVFEVRHPAPGPLPHTRPHARGEGNVRPGLHTPHQLRPGACVSARRARSSFYGWA